MAEEKRQSATDSLGLPRPMWWLWPFVVLLIVIWVISLWAVRVADTQATLGVVTSHRGLGNTAQAEVALFVPSTIRSRVLGERVDVTCQDVTLIGQVFTESGNILSVQDIRDWVGSRLLAERLFNQGVRLQQVVTESDANIPAPGEHCDVTLISGRVRLIDLLGRSLSP
ncbi:hypothetical protein OA099_00200 [Litorivicinus sp.]|nr:hypothetical protein [Litorivicinus sp.]MEC8694048.1 hypothetical protein [Pseudomonadota bacterium]MEC9076567.1 hypothetical protein [Pseudomonadota bacterium]